MRREQLMSEVKNEYARLADQSSRGTFISSTVENNEAYYEKLLQNVLSGIRDGRFDQYQSGKEIVEATSGNTGIALAAMGAFFGNPVHIFMPDWVSKERVDLMKMYNAKITLISKEEGGFKKAISV